MSIPAEVNGAAPRDTVDAAEVAKFDAMAADWWDPMGKFRPLHLMNPCRLDYIADQIAAQHGRDRRARRPFEGLRIADIGCGGGLLSEPMARLGADVTGFDAAKGSIAAARAHAASVGLAIDYRAEMAETAVTAGEIFDAVLALEVVEHVADRPAFLATIAALLRPGGVAILSTMNRTAKSWALAVVVAERVLRWLPAGTHDWAKFPTPEELEAETGAAGLAVVDAQGMKLNALRGEWRLAPDDLSVNYIMTAEKAA